MKETIKINLDGQLFDLDNDAYEKLKLYLDSIAKKFQSAPEDGEEIINDIEGRIAELLQLKITDKKQVINLADIDEIISQLGSAEEMESNGSEPENSDNKSDNSQSYSSNSSKKRLYRDSDNSMLGGVCSGIAAYFAIDPLWIRLALIFAFFIKLFVFSFLTFLWILIPLYIVLWVIIPPAKTTAQKLEMKGKAVTIDNIKNSVKEESEKVKSSFSKIQQSDGYQRFEHGISEVFKVFGNIFIALIKFVGIVIGVSLLLAVVLSIIGLIIGGAIIHPGHWFNDWHVPSLMSWPHFTFAGLCLILLIGIPAIALIVKITKWLFGIKGRNPVASSIGATIWVLAVISFIVLIVIDIDRGTFRKMHHTEYILEHNLNDTLVIEVDEQKDYDHSMEHYHFFNLDIIHDEWNDTYLGEPEIKIRRSDNENIELDIYKSYFNFGFKKNYHNRSADYKWNYTGSSLQLDEYFSIENEHVWRIPKVEIIITIPYKVNLSCDREVSYIFGLDCEKNRYEEQPEISEKQENDSLKEKIKLLEELEEDLEE